LTAKDDRLLDYISESIVLVHRYTVEGRGQFLSDTLRQDAVLRRLETLADACGGLSDDLKERHPNLNWTAIAGFRNVLAHAYDQVSLDIAWRIVEVELPALESMLAAERDKNA
jgi:uncharacterized protein with HEPN domain